jgi:hypothetical protein
MEGDLLHVPVKLGQGPVALVDPIEDTVGGNYMLPPGRTECDEIARNLFSK